MTIMASAFSGDSNSLFAKPSFTLSQKTVSADADGAIEGFVVLTEQVNNVISTGCSLYLIQLIL